MSEDVAECPTANFRFPPTSGVRPVQVRSNGDRCCGYCGSWLPEQFEAWLDKIAAEPGLLERSYIELNDSCYKVYCRQDGVSNASDGAIKAYVNHMSQGLIDKVNALLRRQRDENVWAKDQEAMMRRLSPTVEPGS